MPRFRGRRNKMKKKIKDLTLEECKNICSKYRECDKGCPLNDKEIPCDFMGLLPEDLEKEVEIDE